MVVTWSRQAMRGCGARRADGLHRRVRRIVLGDDGNSTPYDYFYNAGPALRSLGGGGWQTLEVRKHDDTAAYKQFIWDIRYIDAPVARWCDLDGNGIFEADAGEVHYYTGGANFNVTALMDANTGDVVERYLYDPYGRRTVLDGNDDADPNVTQWAPDGDNLSDYNNALGHQGLPHDNESGFVDNRRRPRHPGLGGWPVRDPNGYVDGMNLYEYATANPILRTDPTGRTAMTCERVLSVTPGSAKAFRWLDKRWILVAIIPDDNRTHGGEMGISASYPKLLYLRRYVELFKCCDATDCPVARWGKPTAAGGSETPLEGAIYTSVDFNLTLVVPLPWKVPGQPTPLKFNLAIIWQKGANPQAEHSHGIPTSTISWTAPKYHVPKGYKLVDHIACDTFPYTFPPKGGIPTPPTVSPPKRIKPYAPGNEWRTRR